MCISCGGPLRRCYALVLGFGKWGRALVAQGSGGNASGARNPQRGLPKCALRFSAVLLICSLFCFSMRLSFALRADLDVSRFSASIGIGHRHKAGKPMKSTDHLHQQIARATSRLAQLQAQELVVEQRKAARARAEARRASEQRKRRLAELVIQAGAQDLSDDEIIAALISSRRCNQTSGDSL